MSLTFKGEIVPALLSLLPHHRHHTHIHLCVKGKKVLLEGIIIRKR